MFLLHEDFCLLGGLYFYTGYECLNTLGHKLMCMMKSIINYFYYCYHDALAKLSVDYIPGSVLGILHVSAHSSFKIIL